MRAMAIDYGDSRIGIAISDDYKKIAFPKEVYKRVNKKKDISYLVDLIVDEKIDEVIFGLAKNMSGEEGVRVELQDSFIKVLKKRMKYKEELTWDVEILTFDERLTTKLALEYMSMQNTFGKDRKKIVDKIAANIILQDYLDNKNME